DVGALDGLDARGEWPPLLRPGVLMDPDSYSVWERRAVTALTRGPSPPRQALVELAAITSAIAAWTPGSDAPLRDRVESSFGRETGAAGTAGADDRAVKRWLAARLFGAWAAYQGDGLAATLRYLEACLDVFDAEFAADGSAFEAIRRSDL